MSRHDPFHKITDKLLLDLVCEMRKSNEQGQEHTRLLRRILHAVEPRFPISFSLQQSGEIMVPLDPGQSPQFTATPTPDGSSLGAVVPTWTSSDPANAPVTADATGLVATVALSASIAVGASVTLTVSATSTDGTQSATGTFTFTIGAPPPAFPTGFTIAQSA
jgi:hypothetical protein